jgi:hypothetical protein
LSSRTALTQPRSPGHLSRAQERELLQGELPDLDTHGAGGVHAGQPGLALCPLRRVLPASPAASPPLTSATCLATGIGAAWVYLFFVRGDAPLAVGGRVLSEREKLMAASGASVLVIFFLTNVGSVLFSAICIGLAGACCLAPRCLLWVCLRGKAQASVRMALCACRTTCSSTRSMCVKLPPALDASALTHSHRTRAASCPPSRSNPRLAQWLDCKMS